MNISFCVASSAGELAYTQLLLDSLKRNTDISRHEVLIYIDTNDSITFDALNSRKSDIPNLRIYQNKRSFAIGLQRNLSIMFKAAKNDVVCYLQSDMVVGKNLDEYIAKELDDKNLILSFARIEPPLHPPSSDKITMDIGDHPSNFDWEKFDDAVVSLQSEDRPQIETNFAPFALFKETWFTLGGFDIIFRCSREDSDFIVRCKLHNIKLRQSWNTIVYHYTCISSRGTEWFKNTPKSKYTNQLQQLADSQEVARFIRKWGKFDHNINHVYDIGLIINMDVIADFNLLMSVEPFFSKVYINNAQVRDHLTNLVTFNSSYYTNIRRNFPSDKLALMRELYDKTDFNDRILLYGDLNVSTAMLTVPHDVAVGVNFSDMMNNQEILSAVSQIHDIIHETEVGDYEFSGMSVKIRAKRNLVMDRANLIYNNKRYIDDITQYGICKFE